MIRFSTVAIVACDACFKPGEAIDRPHISRITEDERHLVPQALPKELTHGWIVYKSLHFCPACAEGIAALLL